MYKSLLILLLLFVGGCRSLLVTKNDESCVALSLEYNQTSLEFTITAKNLCSRRVTIEDFFYTYESIPMGIALITHDEEKTTEYPEFVKEIEGWNPNYGISTIKRPPPRYLSLQVNESVSKTFDLYPFFYFEILNSERKKGHLDFKSSPDADYWQNRIDAYSFQFTNFASMYDCEKSFPQNRFKISPDAIGAKLRDNTHSH